MLKIIYEERGLTLRHMTFGNARDRIEIRKQMTETEYYRDLIAMPLDGLYRKYQEAVEAEDIIFYGYLYQQKKCFGLDYNDLINFSLYIFEQNEEICRKWQERLEYIMIDEFQDIDAPQYRLMRVLADIIRISLLSAIRIRQFTPGGEPISAICWTLTGLFPVQRRYTCFRIIGLHRRSLRQRTA